MTTPTAPDDASLVIDLGPFIRKYRHRRHVRTITDRKRRGNR